MTMRNRLIILSGIYIATFVAIAFLLDYSFSNKSDIHTTTVIYQESKFIINGDTITTDSLLKITSKNQYELCLKQNEIIELKEEIRIKDKILNKLNRYYELEKKGDSTIIIIKEYPCD